jgi:hypothetical protein
VGWLRSTVGWWSTVFFYPNLPKILGITIINHHNHHPKNHCLPSIMESFLGFWTPSIWVYNSIYESRPNIIA